MAVNNGKDLESRSDLLAAASMGSTAFQKGLRSNSFFKPSYKCSI